MINTAKAFVRWWRADASAQDSNHVIDKDTAAAPLGEAPPCVSPVDTLVPASSKGPPSAAPVATQEVVPPRPCAIKVDYTPSQRAREDFTVEDCDEASGVHIKLMRLRSLTDIPKFVTSNTAVFFDLDETLVRRSAAGRDQLLELTQSDTALVVERLQEREDVCVFGLTARPYIVGTRLSAARTHMNLLRLGIDFLRNAQVYPRVRHPSPLVGFRSGCAYTGGHISKGDMLQHLFGQLPMRKLVFIDDLADNLHSVAKFAANARIPCLAVHYTGGLDGPRAMDQGSAWVDLCTTWRSVGASVVVAKPG